MFSRFLVCVVSLMLPHSMVVSPEPLARTVHCWHDGRQFPVWGITPRAAQEEQRPSCCPQHLSRGLQGCDKLRDAVAPRLSPGEPQSAARPGRALLCLEYLCGEQGQLQGFTALPDIYLTRTLLQDRICT